MGIEDFLSPDDALVGLKAPDKQRLLRELAERAAAKLQLDPPELVQALQKREQLGSTGMGNGIAIPHARIAGLEKPFGIFAQLRRPIDYEAIDGQPVDLVFLLLQSASSPGDLNALAAVARCLREPDRLKALRAASNAVAAYQELVR
jgi:PTS system nitrogen regulatory IIA component